MVGNEANARPKRDLPKDIRQASRARKRHADSGDKSQGHRTALQLASSKNGSGMHDAHRQKNAEAIRKIKNNIRRQYHEF